jgi:hypothetical protein
MKIKDFCIFILSHGRADNITTYKTLKKAGYNGDVYIVIDNEDDTSEQYYEKYGDKVLMFNKLEVSKTFDEADNFDNRKSIVYARNVCFDLAKKMNYTYFMQLDDDYSAFEYRVYNTSKCKPKKIRKNINYLLELILKFYKKTNAKSIAIAQGGDFIGGNQNSNAKNPKLKRKCMNTFVCSTERPFKFVGRINEDVNTYTYKASKGDLFFTIPYASIVQKTTQSNKGGMTDIYIDNGTYVKSFYSVMFHPSSVKVGLMGDTNKRLHHKVNWNNTAPKILNEQYKKQQIK